MIEYYDTEMHIGWQNVHREVGMIMEYAYASLDYMLKNKISLGNWASYLQQTSQLIQLLALLQKNHIAHRDIKPENIVAIELGKGEF